MKEVLPDVLVDVKYAATDRWRKKAKAVFDEQGRLRLWHPTKARKVSSRDAKRDVKRKAASAKSSR
jgi:hypothetical protein